LILTSLDGQPIASSGRLLLAATARTTNTGFRWEDDHQTVAEWGRGPVLIEPVTGTVTLRDLEPARAVRVRALSPVGAERESVPATAATGSWTFEVGAPATTWYLVEPER
jgi:hypothetical protein